MRYHLPANTSSVLYSPDGVRWATSAQTTFTIYSVEELMALPARLQRWQQEHPGGFATGILSYESGLALQDIDVDGLANGTAQGVATDSAQKNTEAQQVGRTPLAIVHLYPPDAETHQAAAAPLTAIGRKAFTLNTPFRHALPDSRYIKAIEAIHRYEKAGDCYQVNYARRFSGRYRGHPIHAFAALTQQHPAPWASYFASPHGTVFSCSPECFFRVKKGQIVTEPIKGSRPRSTNPQSDVLLGKDLLDNAKDRAENLMIVDLLRNDLGKIAATGSVSATPLFELRKYSNVQHLVSTVRATLKPDVLPLAALLACFPGGSITGAPKKRAMEIIQELEPTPRNFYCGSQFWLHANGNLDANILIRTFQAHNGEIVCHGGGGIVVDSEAESELEESAFKIRALMDTLATKLKRPVKLKRWPAED